MSAAEASQHPKRTISALVRSSSEPVEGKAPNVGSAGNPEASASSPLPVKKRRRRDKPHNHGPSNPGRDSTPPQNRFAAPEKWAPEKSKAQPAKKSPSQRENPKIKTFSPGKPTKEYLEKAGIPTHRSDPTSLATETTKSKLLILDLNGTLLYRKKLPNSSGRKPYPRPYMPAFLSWIFHPDNALETMIWSSAQPENVKNMVKICFGEEHEPKLKVIWARDTLGLSKADYNQKVQTVKNLDVVWEKLPYSVENTLLIDDSPLKAHMQPYNHLVLKEYDRELFERRHDSGLSKDETLLAVIGVLSEAIRQSNVAHWIREGGLIKPPGYQASEARGRKQSPTGPKPSSLQEAEGSQRTTPEKTGLAYPERRRTQVSPGRSRSLTSSPIPETSAETLSDSAAEMLARSETLWFQEQDIVSLWVELGKAELERLGIAADVGAIDGNREPIARETVTDNTPQPQAPGAP